MADPGFQVGVPTLGGVNISSGSSGRVEVGRGGAEKHEIYAAEFGGHLFYDLFLQGRGGAGHAPPDPLLNIQFCQIFPKLHEKGGRPKFYYVGPPLVKAPQLQSMVIYIFFKFGINYDNQNLKFNTYSCI